MQSRLIVASWSGSGRGDVVSGTHLAAVVPVRHTVGLSALLVQKENSRFVSSTNTCVPVLVMCYQRIIEAAKLA